MKNINRLDRIIIRSIRAEVNDFINWVKRLYYTCMMHVWVLSNILFPCKDEFSKRLNIKPVMAYYISRENREYYINKLVHFRNKAHNRDL